MFFHVWSIVIRVEMGILIRIFSLTVPEHMLCEGGAGHAVEMGCCRVSEEVCMQVFMDREAISGRSKHVL